MKFKTYIKKRHNDSFGVSSMRRTDGSDVQKSTFSSRAAALHIETWDALGVLSCSSCCHYCDIDVGVERKQGSVRSALRQYVYSAPLSPERTIGSLVRPQWPQPFHPAGLGIRVF
eukprot:GHVU01224977.1.p2 GENE.GHVU01224977.1~~GHVU01224977.1.p2  ORF type:complete len:115 (+),score=0.70 GHVU01224977.1:526-870(+)